MIFDFILIFTVVISIFMGYKKGFAQTLLSFAVFLFSIAIVTGIYSYLGDTLFESDYGVKMLTNVSQSIEEHLENAENDILKSAPYLSIFGLGKDDGKPTAINNKSIAYTLASKSLRAIMTIPLVIISFISLKILVFILRQLVKRTTSLPIIRSVDSLLGSVCGLLAGVIASMLIYVIAGYIQYIPELDFVKEQFSSSLIAIAVNDFIF